MKSDGGGVGAFRNSPTFGDKKLDESLGSRLDLVFIRMRLKYSFELDSMFSF